MIKIEIIMTSQVQYLDFSFLCTIVSGSEKSTERTFALVELSLSPFISSSGLSPGSREAKVQRPRSASIARSQVWLGLPVGRFQSGGTCQIAAARDRW